MEIIKNKAQRGECNIQKRVSETIEFREQSDSTYVCVYTCSHIYKGT